jgi:hypothetical protein
MLPLPLRNVIVTKVPDGADAAAGSYRLQLEFDLPTVNRKDCVGAVSGAIQGSRQVKQVNNPVLSDVVLGNPSTSHEHSSLKKDHRIECMHQPMPATM